MGVLTRAEPTQPPPTQIDIDGECLSVKVLSSKYDRYCQSLLQMDDREGWSLELRHYLNDRPVNVTKDTNIVKWWQNNALLFLTLARIALNILLCQASSMPCEHLFSANKCEENWYFSFLPQLILSYLAITYM